MWYLSYRLHGSTRMHIFKTRELALRAACQLIGGRDDKEVEVGPMLASRDGNVFQGEELRRVCANGTT